MDRAFVKASFLAFAAFALLLIAGGGIVYRTATDIDDARHQVERTRDIIDQVRVLFLTVEDAESEQRGYLLTDDDRYLGHADDAIRKAPKLLDALAALTSDNSAQQERIAQLRPILQKKLDEVAETIRLMRVSEGEAALQIVRSNAGQAWMDQIRSITDAITIDEQSQLRTRLARISELNSIAIEGALVVVVISVLGLTAALALLRQGLRHQHDAEAAARAQAGQLRTTLESLSQGIAVFDEAQCLVTWNRCFADLLGIPPRLARIGASYVELADFLAGEDNAPFLESPAEIAVLTTSGQGAEVVVFERKSRNEHVFEIRRSPMSVGGFVLTVTDNTERARAEMMMRNAQRMEAVGHLTGGLAHDFNNLLLVILGNLDLVRKRLRADPELTPRLGAVTRAAERGAALTRQLLAFARRQPLAPVPLNVNRLVEEMKNLLRRSLGESMDVEIIQSAGLWDTLADPAQLESVLLNLALNARDAMPRGGKLTIETANTVLDDVYARRQEDVTPGQYVMLAVTDTGTGMPPDIAARAFEPFFTTKPEGQGTGLGLSQVYGFVKQSNGHVKIYSEESHGTTAKIYLPRTMRAALGRPQRAPLDMKTGSESILVVEDDEDVKEMVIGQLEQLGYRALAAKTAPEALAVLGAGEKVDLLFTDVILPGPMRGGELAAEARRQFPSLAVVFTSGYTENSIVHGGIIDNRAMLLSKPYRIEALAAKIRLALDNAKRGNG